MHRSSHDEGAAEALGVLGAVAMGGVGDRVLEARWDVVDVCTHICDWRMLAQWF